MNRISAETIGTALGGKISSGQWICKCPAHDDSSPSLAVKDAESGKILIKCYAGCDSKNVIEVLKEMGLWPDRSSFETRIQVPLDRSTPEGKKTVTFPSLESLVSFLGKKGVVQIYKYPLANGIPWGMARIDKIDEKKSFIVWHEFEGKIFLRKPPVAKLPLYKSDQLPADKKIPIYIVEGEKCAEALSSLCVPVVTSSNGAGNAKNSDWSPLSDRPLIIWPDNDSAGEKYKKELFDLLGGKAILVDIEKLGLNSGEDCADWIANGHDDLSSLPLLSPCDQEGAEVSPDLNIQGTQEDSEDPHYTDLGNCFRLTRRHGENIRYVGIWKKWLVWQGTHWGIDNSGKIERLAKDTALHIHEEIIGETERLMQTVEDLEREKIKKKIKEILGWAKKSETDNRLAAMINLTKSEKEISLTPQEFDTDPLLLGVKNGVIDLQRGILIEAKRGQYITKVAGVEFQPEAKSPAFKDFLEKIQPDPDVRSFLKKWCGYCLTGDTTEQCFTIFYGTGRNGKTTLVDTIMHILGSWARQADFKTFALKDRDSASNDLARLFGTRVVTATEGQENSRLDEAVIKSLTGGDRITARFLYSEFFEYTPSFKLILSSNHRPIIRGTDEGIWRRIRLVPFSVTIPEGGIDLKLKSKLFSEASGILNWMIEGCLEWQRSGLGLPSAIAAATGDYREGSDLIGRWITEQCIVDRRATSTVKDLYSNFILWAEEEGIQYAPTKKKLLEALEDKGFAKKRGSGGGMVLLGITLSVKTDSSSNSLTLTDSEASEWSEANPKRLIVEGGSIGRVSQTASLASLHSLNPLFEKIVCWWIGEKKSGNRSRVENFYNYRIDSLSKSFGVTEEVYVKALDEMLERKIFIENQNGMGHIFNENFFNYLDLDLDGGLDEG